MTSWAAAIAHNATTNMPTTLAHQSDFITNSRGELITTNHRVTRISTWFNDTPWKVTYWTNLKDGFRIDNETYFPTKEAADQFISNERRKLEDFTREIDSSRRFAKHRKAVAKKHLTITRLRRRWAKQPTPHHY